MLLPCKSKEEEPNFKKNLEYQTALEAELKDRLATARLGGGEAQIDRVHKANKLTARERIKALIDPGSEFLEFSPLAGYGLYDEDVPSASLITGIGRIHQRPVLIAANDATVKGGTYYPITVRKHLRVQEIAFMTKLPCLYLVDSGGAYLPMQDEVFPDHDDFGRIFYNQARLSAMGVAQIAAVMGFCTAGGAYIPAMADQNVIVKGTGSIFLGGPPLVKAATGEDVSVEELGGAFVHSQISGVSDHFAEDDAHALDILREIVEHLGPLDPPALRLIPPKPPAYDPSELKGFIPEDLSRGFDIFEVLGRVLDDSKLFEFKKNYGKTLITGFGHIEGIPVGIIANNGILFSESALKGAHFVELCCKERIPIIFFQNITGFMVGKKYEHGGIAKDGAKLVHAVACAHVPKITLILGGSYGAGNYGMCGRGYSPHFLYMWPGAKISVMGGEQAASVLSTVKADQMAKKGVTLSPEDIQAIKAPILEKYAKESSAYYSSARLWDDGIILPEETRKVLAMSLGASLCAPWDETKFGVFRM